MPPPLPCPAYFDVRHDQYTALVSVVVLTAVVPTAIVQALVKPSEEPEEMESEVP
ncbi:MAG TPA: hypothetical protein VMT95_01505 [Candidatus Binatia bacterium]|nr:hypothetical protein [Candidatus Binatia bacterium]